MEGVLDIGRIHKPVLSVLRRSLKFDMAKSLVLRATVRMEVSKNVGCLHAHQLMNL